jgi:hypothetical protein
MILRRLLWISVLCVPVQAATLRLDARDIFNRAVTRDISLSADGSALLLNSGEMVQDDGPAAGFSYKPSTERLSSTVWIRKQLVIADPRASKALLMVGPGGNLKVTVNGHPQALAEPRKVGNTWWQEYAIDPAALKAGVNDVVVSGTGRVWIARSDDSPVELPHRSARSADGGVSWGADRLGPAGDISGEYYVRVLLEHYRPQGSILFPVMDVANLAAAPLAPPVAAAGPLHISLRAETGAQQDVSLRVRTGTTYVPGKGTWSEWAPLARSGRLETPRGRYVQVEATLATHDPLVTPKLQEITVETEPKAALDWTKAVKVVDAHNEEIVRTSIPFQYEPFNQPKLKELRTRYHLDDVVAGAKSEFELITKLSAWSVQQWKWAEWHLDDFYPAWDALEILKKGPDGKPVGGFCLQYDMTFLQACESFGLVGRELSISNGMLGKPDTAGHEPNEVWSNQFRKWIYVDGTGAWYAEDSAGVPLNLLEVHERQVPILRGQTSAPIKIVTFQPTVHDWRGLDKDVSFAELRLIPRSNFLEQKDPLPLNQGKRGWFWPGHYVWSDSLVEPDPIYTGRLVTSRNNFEWTLDQAHYTLEAGRTPGELLVHLDTETPGFETFLAEIDGAAKQPVKAIFPWKLHPGVNRLRVWPRNNAGRDGIASWITLEMPGS